MKKLLKFKSFTLIMLTLFIVSCSSDDDNVEDINSFPVAVNMSATSEAGAAVEIELVATDADYDPLTFSIVTQPTIGTVTISGKIATYAPNENA
jgi:YbbR domain-containing protein